MKKVNEKKLMVGTLGSKKVPVRGLGPWAGFWRDRSNDEDDRDDDGDESGTDAGGDMGGGGDGGGGESYSPADELIKTKLNESNDKTTIKYRLYHSPEGVDGEYHGEFDTFNDAKRERRSVIKRGSSGLARQHFGTARAAGHFDGYSAPDLNGEEDWEGSNYDGDHAIVPTIYRVKK